MRHLDLETAHRLIGGALDGETASALQSHIESCETCRALVAEERSVMAILGLDEQPRQDSQLPPDNSALDRLLGRIGAALPRGRAADRWRSVKLYSALGTVAISIAVLAFSFRPQADEHELVARELSISPKLAAQVTGELQALRVLREEPWVADDFESVLAFEQLIASGEK